MKSSQVLKKEITNRIINTTLTPQNAKEQGYEYIDDVVYDEFTSSPTMKIIFELTDQHGFKLGLPKSNYDSWYGLYAPVR